MNNPPLSVRFNNPGNLRAVDLGTAKGYWGDRVTGVDNRGYVQFADPPAGLSALYQQLGIDTGRDLTLGEFINKYTPASDDPSGNAAALANIPSFLGVGLGAKLSSIDPQGLANAIIRQEGGQPAVDYYTAPSQQTMVSGAVGGITAKRPDEAQFYPATDDERANAKAQMRLSNMGANVGLTQFNTAPENALHGGVFESIIKNLTGLRGAKNTPTVEIRGLNGQTMQGEEALRALGAENPTLTAQSPELQQVASQMAPTLDRSIRANRLMQQGPIRLREDVSPAPQPDPIENVTVENAVDAPAQPAAKPPTALQQPSAPPSRNSILSFLGKNPELISALGVLGQGVGGLMQGRAQDRANRSAAKEQRVNNAVAAFLGRPAEMATPRTATSTGGGLLGALGAALKGVGDTKIAQNALDAELQSKERMAGLKAGGGEGGGGEIANALASFNAYTGALDRAVNEGLGGKPYADFILEIPLLKRMFPEAQAAQPMFEAAALNIATAIQGARPSEGDRIAFAMLMPQLSDSAAARQAKIRNIRELLNAAQGGSKFEEGWAVRSLQENMGSGAGTFGSLGSAQSVMAGN